MSKFIGKWSSYEYKGYGTMEDCQVVFCPDGSGWYEFMCLGGGELMIFSWHSTDNGKIKITDKHDFLVNSDGSLEKNEDGENEMEDDDESCVSVEMEVTSGGEEKEVLTTGLFFGSKFALVSREPEELKRKP